MKKYFNRYALAITGSTILAVAPASAINTFYVPGDLVLYFQKEGSTNTVYASLGNTATFRGTVSGIGGSANQLNILNLNSTLESAFGMNWASDTGIYAGLAGVWGTSNTSITLQNGDPHRTLYYSASRATTGTVGAANSAGRNFNAAGDAAMTSGATGISQNNNPFDTNFNAQQTVALTSQSGIDEQNPFLIPGVQGTAFAGTFGGGVQQVGTAGDRGNYEDAGTAEFALDLYRMQARNNISGQVTGTNRVGSFEGTVVIDSAGDVSFLVSPVPEPSAIALSGLAAGFAVFRRRRSA